MSLELPWTRSAGLTQAASLYTQLQSAVTSVPGVLRTAVVTTLPLSHDRQFTRFNITGKPPALAAQAPTAVSEYVTPGYFETLGIPLLGGRDFTAQDDSGAPPVAILSETMAKRYWPDGSAIGRDLDLYGTRYQIVGIAGDVRDQMESAPAITIYQPALQSGNRNVTLVVRSACSSQTAGCDAEMLAPAIERAIASVSRNVAVSNVRAMPRVVKEYVSPWRLLMTLIGTFAVAALIIAAVGIYGVTMSSVVQRTHEIGIRMALGADRRQVLRMIVRDAAHFIGWGATFGVLGALAATRALPFLLFGVSPADPAVIGGIAALLAIVALLASWLPARRAASVDPMTALRRD